MRNPALLVAVLLTSGLAAQCPLPNSSEGPFAGVPLVFSEAVEAANGTLVKCPGYQPASQFPLPGRPDLDIGRALATLAGGRYAPEIDALSFGWDVVLSDTAGVAKVPAGRWGTLLFSVTPDATGTGGLITAEANGPGGAAGDVFSYVLPGSALSPFASQVQRAQDATELLAAPGPQPDLDSMDALGPMLLMDDRLFTELQDLPVQVFFSVPNRSLGAVPTSWWGSTKPSGATILVMKWDWNNLAWITPAVYYTYEDLGLDEDEDLDALAVDLSGDEPVIMLSTAGKRRPQLLVSFPSMESIASLKVYTSAGGLTVPQSIGLQPEDDINALCDVDPTIADDQRFWAAPHPLNGLHPIRFAMAWPVLENRLGLPVALQGSGFVDFHQGGADSYLSWGSGWPSGVPAAGGVLLLAEIPLPAPFLTPLSGALLRNPTSITCGDPQLGGFPLNGLGAARLSNLVVYMHWIGLDAGPPLVASYPLRIHL